MPHILLVEDEALVRLALQMVLADDGFEVSTAEDGLAALNAVAGVDLVVTDILMPGMNGLELAKALRERRPELPIVVMTGCVPSDGGTALSELRSAGIPVVMKPFMPEDVLGAVRARLGLPGGPRTTARPAELALAG